MNTIPAGSTSSAGAAVDAADERGLTALHKAAEAGSTARVQQLLDAVPKLPWEWEVQEEEEEAGGSPGSPSSSIGDCLSSDSESVLSLSESDLSASEDEEEVRQLGAM